MGEYWMFICVDSNGRVVARLNPQRGFGGMKIGEYIGTQKGDKMLLFLNDYFCPRDSVWGYGSDYGGRVFPDNVHVPDDVYEAAKYMEDMGCNYLLRRMADRLKLTEQNPHLRNYWDTNTEMWIKMAKEHPQDIPIGPYTSPDVFNIIPRLRRRKMWAVLFASFTFVSLFHRVSSIEKKGNLTPNLIQQSYSLRLR